MKKYTVMIMLAMLAIAPLTVRAEDKPAAPAVAATQQNNKESRHEARKAILDKLSPAVKEELKTYKDARKALYDKLSPEAKQALKDMRGMHKNKHAEPMDEPAAKAAE